MKKMFFLLITIVLFAIDFISKYLITNNIEYGKSIVIIPNFFSITYVKNYGAAFSSFEGSKYLLILVAFIVLGFLIYTLLDDSTAKLEKIFISIMMAGIIGNLVDRIFYGYVIDMFEFNIGSFAAPIFNVADIFIVVGTFCWLISMNMGGKLGNSK